MGWIRHEMKIKIEPRRTVHRILMLNMKTLVETLSRWSDSNGWSRGEESKVKVSLYVSTWASIEQRSTYMKIIEWQVKGEYRFLSEYCVFFLRREGLSILLVNYIFTHFVYAYQYQGHFHFFFIHTKISYSNESWFDLIKLDFLRSTKLILD